MHHKRQHIDCQPEQDRATDQREPEIRRGSDVGVGTMPVLPEWPEGREIQKQQCRNAYGTHFSKYRKKLTVCTPVDDLPGRFTMSGKVIQRGFQAAAADTEKRVSFVQEHGRT